MPSINQQFKHDFEVEATPEVVWSFLWDVEAMGRCIPGCEEVLVREENKDYLARLRRKVGPFVIRMEMDITVVESEAPQRIVMDVTGRDKRLRSQLRQHITVTLGLVGEGRTHVDFDTQFELSGVLATLGWTLLSGHIHQEIDTFVADVQTGIEEYKAKISS